MSCHDARELFSALADDALTSGERAGLDAHLATCGECRRELDRFQRTLALVQGMPAPRAPAGFVDRVLEAARPTPWPVRLARGLFVPWTRKLPLEAAAVVMIAGLAAIVFERTPELQQAARLEEAAPVPAQGPPASGSETGGATASGERERTDKLVATREEGRAESDTGATYRLAQSRREGAERPAEQDAASRRTDATPSNIAQREASPARDAAPPVAQDARAGGAAARDETAPGVRGDDRSATSPPSPESAISGRRAEPDAASSSKAADSAGAVRPERAAPRALQSAPPVEKRTAPATEAKPVEPLRDAPGFLRTPAPAAPGASGAAPAPAVVARPRLSATSMREEAVPVSGRLAALDRAAAERDVSALASRLGARVTSRRAENGATVLDVLVPRDRYAELSSELGRLGTWRTDHEPADGGTLVHVIIQLTP